MINHQDRLDLRHRPDFFQHSQQFFTTSLTFFWQPQSGGVAIIIPKKHLRLSTDRHAWKRQIAAALQPHIRQLKNHSIAIVATKNLEKATRSEISESIKSFLQYLHIK